MTHEELQAAYDKLLQENGRLKRLAEDAREKLDAAMDGTGLCIWQNHVPTGKLIIFNRRWGSSISPVSEHGQMGCGGNRHAAGVAGAWPSVCRGSAGQSASTARVSYAASGATGDRADRSRVASFYRTPAATPAWRGVTWQRH